MRVGTVVQGPIEWIARRAGVIPVPILDIFPTIVFARTVMAATSLGIFESLAEKDRSAEEIAQHCQTDVAATRTLLMALVASAYLVCSGDRYGLGHAARRWLLAASPHSLRDFVAYHYAQWEWIGELETFIKTGKPIAAHQTMDRCVEERYQEAMAAIARLFAPEVARRLHIPAQARTLLDIGGGHGRYAAALRQRHAQLRVTILDLPRTTAYNARRYMAECRDAGMQFVAGDLLTADLGHETYDQIFIANVLHHFDRQQNACLLQRVARALRPGGQCIVMEGIRATRGSLRQLPALGNLYFALTSAAGIYSFSDIAGWQRRAGLHPARPMRLITAPDQGLQIAAKRGG